MSNQYHIDLRTLAVGSLYLLMNRGTLHFPGSDKSHPSRKVVVDLSGKKPLRDGDRVYFPFSVHWAMWEDAIVPVLENKDVQVFVTDNPSLRVHLNFALTCRVFGLEWWETLINKIEWYLEQSLIAHGYLPGEPTEDEGLPDSCPPAPSEIDYTPTGPTGPDVGDLLHPDGTPKLIYNIVDSE